MRPPRRLAYRDRYVWALTQTMTGGSSVLPPFQFPASGEGQFIVGMTMDEWVKVFSALMTGADLLYPDEAHEVVWSLLRNLEFPLPVIGYGYDSRVDLWSRTALITTGNPMAVTLSATTLFAWWANQSPGAINDRHDYITYLSSGTYSVRVWYLKIPGSGIATLKARPDTGTPVTIGTVDMYNATTQVSQIAALGFTIADSARYIISVEALTKNAASAGYVLPYTLIEIWRNS